MRSQQIGRGDNTLNQASIRLLDKRIPICMDGVQRIVQAFIDTVFRVEDDYPSIHVPLTRI